jgi:hypothetical protein
MSANRNTPNTSRRRSFPQGTTLVIRTEWRVNGVLTTPTNYACTFTTLTGTEAADFLVVESTGVLKATHTPISAAGGRLVKWWWTADEGYKEGSAHFTGDLRIVYVGPAGEDYD